MSGKISYSSTFGSLLLTFSLLSPLSQTFAQTGEAPQQSTESQAQPPAGSDPQMSSAPVFVGGRHVYILYSGVDSIWGSYIFEVNNNTTTPQHFSFPVMLPKETLDFQAQDTLSPQELTLGKDGGVTIEKDFAPGENLIQISFKLPATQGASVATFKTNFPFETLGVFVWENSFGVQGPSGLEIKKGVNLSGRNYDTYSLAGGSAGQTLTFNFDGISEGRSRLWVIGWVFAGILAITGIGMAYLTRPQLSREEVV